MLPSSNILVTPLVCSWAKSFLQVQVPCSSRVFNIPIILTPQILSKTKTYLSVDFLGPLFLPLIKGVKWGNKIPAQAPPHLSVKTSKTDSFKIFRVILCSFLLPLSYNLFGYYCFHRSQHSYKAAQAPPPKGNFPLLKPITCHCRLSILWHLWVSWESAGGTMFNDSVWQLAAYTQPWRAWLRWPLPTN